MSQILKLTSDKSVAASVVLDVDILKDSSNETLNLWVAGLESSSFTVQETEVTEGNETYKVSRVYPKGVKVGEVYSISIGHTVADKTYFGKNISITATSEDSSLLIEAFITAIQERITADTENTTAWSQLISYTKFISSEGVSLQLRGNGDTYLSVYEGVLQLKDDSSEQKLAVVTLADIEASENTKVEVKDTLAQSLAEKGINTLNDIAEQGSLRNTIKKLSVINFQEASETTPQISFIKFDSTEPVADDLYLLDIDGEEDIKYIVDTGTSKNQLITDFAKLIEDEGTGAWANVNATADIKNKHIRVQGQVNVAFGLEKVQTQVEQLDAHAYQLEFTSDINFTDEEDRLTTNQKLIDNGVRSDQDVSKFTDASFMRQIRFEIGDINAFILKAKASVRQQLREKIAESLRTQSLYNNAVDSSTVSESISSLGAAANDALTPSTDLVSQLNSRFSPQCYSDPNNTAVSPTAYLADLTNYVMTYLKYNSSDPAHYPWSTNNIGIHHVGGNFFQSNTNGQINIVAAGHDIWSTKDDFRFAYKEVQGDGVFIAKLLNVDTVEKWTKMGIMIRDSLSPDSVNLFFHFSPVNRKDDNYSTSEGILSVQGRKNRAAESQGFGSVSNIPTPIFTGDSYYLKLERTISSYVFSYSTDGQVWTILKSISKTDSLGELGDPFYVGLAVSSHHGYETASATFGEMQWEGFTLANNRKNITDISLETLEGMFHQSFSELPAAKDEITDLVCQTRIAIEVLRDRLTSNSHKLSYQDLSTLTLRTQQYFENVYKSFLTKLGTSTNQLLNAKTEKEIANLSSKLGIPNDYAKIEQLLLKTTTYEGTWQEYKNKFVSQRQGLLDAFEQIFTDRDESFSDFASMSENTLAYTYLKDLENTHPFWQAFAGMIKGYAYRAEILYNRWVEGKKVEGLKGGDVLRIRKATHQHQTHYFRISTHGLKFSSAMLWFADYVHWNHFSRNPYSMKMLSALSTDEIAEIFKTANRKVGDYSTFSSKITSDFDCIYLFAKDMLNEAQPLKSKAVDSKLYEQKLEEIFGIEDTTKHPFSDGVIVGDGTSNIIRHKFEDVKWGQNTDIEGNIYLKLLPTVGHDQVSVKIYKDANQTEDHLVAEAKLDELSNKFVIYQENDSGLTGELLLLQLPTIGTETEQISLVPSMLSWQLEQLRHNWTRLDALATYSNDMSIEEKLAVDLLRKNRIAKGPAIDPDILIVSDCKDPYATTDPSSPVSLYNQRKGMVELKMAEVSLTQQQNTNTSIGGFDKIATAMTQDSKGYLYVAERDNADGSSFASVKVLEYDTNADTYVPATNRVQSYSEGNITEPHGLTILRKKKPKPAFVTIKVIQKPALEKEQKVSISLPNTDLIEANQIFIIDLDSQGAIYYEVPDEASSGTAFVALGLRDAIISAIDNNWGNWGKLSYLFLEGNDIILEAKEFNEVFTLAHKPFAVEDNLKVFGDPIDLYYDDQLVIGTKNHILFRDLEDATGVNEKKIGGSGTTLGKYESIKHLEVYNDKLFIADNQNERIVKLAIPQFKTSYIDGDNVKQSFNNDAVVNPSIGVAVDLDGNQFIVDRSNNRLVSLDKNGRFRFQLPSIQEDGEQNVTFDGLHSVHVASNGNLYLTERGTVNRVSVFDPEANLKFVLNERNTEESSAVIELFNRPTIARTDAEGNIYVVDTNNHQIQKFDSEGFYQYSFGRYALEADLNEDELGLRFPTDITFVEKENGLKYLLVPNTYNSTDLNGAHGFSVFKESNDATVELVDRIDGIFALTCIMPALEENMYLLTAGHNLLYSEIIISEDGSISYNEQYNFEQIYGGRTSGVWETNDVYACQGGIDREGTIYIGSQDANDNGDAQLIKLTLPKSYATTGTHKLRSGSKTLQYTTVEHQPLGLDIDKENGFVYVTTQSDSQLGKVWRFDENLNLKALWDVPTVAGTLKLNYSSSIKVDREANVYVAEMTGDHHALRYSPDGEVLSTITSDISGGIVFDDVLDIHFDDHGRLVLAKNTALVRVDIAQNFGKVIEGYIQTTDGTALTEKAFSLLKKRYYKGEDIENNISTYGLSFRMFNELVKVHSQLYAGKQLSEERMQEFYQLIVAQWKEKQYESWIEEELSLGISISQDFFTVLDRSFEQQITQKKWLSDSRRRRAWKRMLTSRIEQEQNIIEEHREMVSEVEDENLISLRDALIMASDFEGDTLDAKAKDATDKLIIDFKNNCCQKTTRISMAIEALQGIMWGVRNGQTQDTYADLLIDNEFFDKEWKWMGSYQSWRSSQFVFMYPENLLIPQLRKSHSQAFTHVLEETASAGITPQKACQLANEYYDEIKKLKNIALVTHFEFTKVDERYCISSRENQSGDYVVLIGIDRASGTFFWTYYNVSEPQNVRFWMKLENDELQKLSIANTVEAKKDPVSGNYHLMMVTNDKIVKSIVFDVNDFNWINTVNDFKIVRDYGDIKVENIEQLVIDKDFNSNYVALLGTAEGPNGSNGGKEGQLAFERYDIDFASKELVFGDNDTHYRYVPNQPGTRFSTNVGNKNVFFHPKLIGMFAGEFLYLQNRSLPCKVITGTSRVKVRSAYNAIRFKKRKVDFVKVKVPYYVRVPAKYETRTSYRDDYYPHSSEYEVRYGTDCVFAYNFNYNDASLVSAFIEKNTRHCMFLISSSNFGRNTRVFSGAQNAKEMRRNWELKLNYISSYANKAAVIYQQYDNDVNPVYININANYEYRHGEKFTTLYNSTFGISLKNFQLPKFSKQFTNDLYKDHKDKSKYNVQSLLKHYPNSFKALGSELHFDLPITLARALQQNGYYTEALDYYRLVYDWTKNSSSRTSQRYDRSTYYGLYVEASYNRLADLSRLDTNGNTTDVDLDWLDDPFNPHAVAKTRANSYTKFTVLQIAQCMLDYADSEFTKDTAETVPRARTLYRTAMEMLDSESLKHLEDECRDLVDTINYTPVDEEYVAIWEKQKSRMLTVPRKANLDQLLIEVKAILSGTESDAEKLEAVDAAIDDQLEAPDPVLSAQKQQVQQASNQQDISAFIANNAVISEFLEAAAKKTETRVSQQFKRVGFNQQSIYRVKISRQSIFKGYTKHVYQYDQNNVRVKTYSYSTPRGLKRDSYGVITIPSNHTLRESSSYVRIYHERTYFGYYQDVLVSETEYEVELHDASRQQFASDSLMATLSGDTGRDLRSEEIIDLADITGDLSHLDPDFIAKYQYDKENPTPEQQEFQKSLRDFANMLYGELGSVPKYTPSTQLQYAVPANPVVNWLRYRAELNLFKIRNCRNIAGVVRDLAPFAAPTDATSGMQFIGSGNSVQSTGGTNYYKPSIYRYDVLIARAKELTNIAQQVEGSFLSALEKVDNESYSLLKAKQDLAIARQGIKLQDLRVKRADSNIGLAELQKERAELQKDHYDELLEEGLIAEETGSIVLQYTSLAFLVAAQVMNIYAVTEEVTNKAGNKIKMATSLGGSDNTNIGVRIQRGLSLMSDVLSKQASILQQVAGYKRREQEWEFASELASKDIDIADQQIKLAEEDKDIVEQEKAIAELQATNAEDTIDFLQNKFTSKELYQWMANVLEDVYRFFLQRASNMAQIAESQLAFERQEASPGYILDDYWESTTGGAASTNNGSGDDRRGLTGSVRLLKDIYQLDEFAFATNKRKLQLKKTISMASLDPSELIQLKKTGVMSIRTSKRLFDNDFPGHYLRLVKNISVKVIALVPPTSGIKATLKSGNISRVDILDKNSGLVQEANIIRDPETVAFTGTGQENGAYELSAQKPELLNPFENTGVVGNWTFIMPKPANQFDFSTIADILFTIEYTALESVDYAAKVVQELEEEDFNSQLTFSLQTNFADAWYEIENPEEATEVNVANCPISSAYLPNNISDITFDRLKMIIVPSSEYDAEFDDPLNAESGPSILEAKLIPEGTTSEYVSTGEVTSDEHGKLDSAVKWGVFNSVSPAGQWSFTLNEKMATMIREGKIEDVFIIIDYVGKSPEWPELYKIG